MDQVVGDVFLVEQVKRGFRFGVDGVDSGNFKTSLAEGLQQSLPDRAFGIGVVKREDEQTIVRKRLMNGPEYSGKSGIEILPTLSSCTVFDDFGGFGCQLRSEPCVTVLQYQAHPDVEEIRKLRVVDVTHVWRVGDEQVE